MPCILVLIGLLMPRLLMFFIFILTDWFRRSFDTVLAPLLGFFVAPYTTLAYMMAMLNNNHQLSGEWILYLVIGVIMDLTCIVDSIKNKRYWSL